MSSTLQRVALLSWRPRWLRFSLRTLLLLTTVVAVWLGIAIKRVRDQEKAVQSILDLGGSVQYDYQVDKNGNYQPNSRPPGPQWLRRLIGPQFATTVVGVNLNGPRFTDGALSHLRKLPKLNYLILHGTQITDRQIRKLRGIRQDLKVSSDVPLDLIAALPTLVKDLNPGMPLDQVWATLGLDEYKSSLGGDGSGAPLGGDKWQKRISYSLRNGFGLNLVTYQELRSDAGKLEVLSETLRSAQLIGSGWRNVHKD